MAILCDARTRLLVQGLGRMGQFHARLSREYDTQVVGGVHPGKGGQVIDGLPVFETVREAVAETGADASVIFVPPPGAADAILEAADAGLALAVCITEGIPVLDMARAKAELRGSPMRLVGPNCPGLVTPGQCRIGIMPAQITRPGSVGVVSRSGTLTYEAVDQLSRLGIGQSTCVGIGGDPVVGTTFVDALAPVPGRSRDARRRDDRRDRRQRRGDGGGLRPRADEQARGRVHRRPERAARQAHGARRARSSPAARAARRTRWPRSKRPASRSRARPPRSARRSRSTSRSSASPRPSRCRRSGAGRRGRRGRGRGAPRRPAPGAAPRRSASRRRGTRRSAAGRPAA